MDPHLSAILKQLIQLCCAVIGCILQSVCQPKLVNCWNPEDHLPPHHLCTNGKSTMLFGIWQTSVCRLQVFSSWVMLITWGILWREEGWASLSMTSASGEICSRTSQIYTTMAPCCRWVFKLNIFTPTIYKPPLYSKTNEQSATWNCCWNEYNQHQL